MDALEIRSRGQLEQFQLDGEEEGSVVESYRALMIPLNVETEDGRIFEALSWRDPPLPMMATDKTSFGHEGAVLVGRFEDFRVEAVDGTDWVVATPVWDDDEEAVEFRRMVDEGFLRGLSADVAVIDADLEVTYDEDGFVDEIKLIVHDGKVLGATILPMPAFADAKVEPEPIEAALEIPVKPEPGLFADPGLPRLTPLTVDGVHVFGHLAPWDECHVGIQDVCTVAPASQSEYALFHAGQVECSDGSMVSAGQITLAGGHAGHGLNWKAAIAHYDDTSSAVADVHIGEDEYGIWFSGALRPGVTDEQLRQLRAAKLSGDWRPYQGQHELIAMLCVNAPGFPFARALVAGGAQEGLILHGMVPDDEATPAVVRLEQAVETLERLALSYEAGELARGL